ncbi:MAG: hypothetical protein WC510_02320 [Candidatus Omnitrophota bacterium]
MDRILAEVLHNLGTQHVLVVHGRDGLDEVTTADKTLVSEVFDQEFRDYEITPEEYGFPRAELKDLLGGDLPENVRIITEVLKGQKGAKRDIVLLNAGCAIYAANKTASIKEGIEMAAQSLDSGQAWEKLQLLKKYSCN